MKRKLLLILCFFQLILAQAAYFKNQPYDITQPDGTVIHCFVSGDEYFNWIHDANGYTIIQAQDGWYYYGKQENGLVVPTQYKVNSVNPEQAGLNPWEKISKDEYERRRDYWIVPKGAKNLSYVHEGRLNNLVIYIKFSDQTEFTNTRQYYDGLFNTNAKSLNSYYKDVSYNDLDLRSYHYPEAPLTTNLSYTDSHPRAYYSPYNAVTNPIGYKSNEATIREHTLLKNAIEWVNANSPVPDTLNIDGDGNNMVDNVCFIIRGGNDGWSSLLWAHRWSLFSYEVYITQNQKQTQVYDYTFQPETQVVLTTLCHEMFHALGAPDLYHYSDNGISPADTWDLMEYGAGHMSAHLKFKYAGRKWVTSIPEITTSGTYTLNPLANPTNNCYMIKSPNSSSEYFVVEYRKKEGLFESSLPGSGLLVWRVNPNLNGNASGPPDEVYVYRPNGTLSANGQPNSAYFSAGSGRTELNDNTNPSAFLANGSPSNLYIYNVTDAGETISFSVVLSSVENPVDFMTTVIDESDIFVEWNLNSSSNDVLLAYNTSPKFGIPADGTSYSAGDELSGGGKVLFMGNNYEYLHSGLTQNTTYYYKLWSVTSDKKYSPGVTTNARTLCSIGSLPLGENFDLDLGCWKQQNSASVTSRWSYSDTQLAGGIKGEVKAVGMNKSNAYTRLVSQPINTTGISQLRLIFRHYVENNGAGAVLTVKTSNDSINWTSSSWEKQTSGTLTEQEQVSTILTQNLNAPKTYIAFEFSGNLLRCKNWSIDDIMLSSETDVVTIGATVNPGGTGTVYGAGMYPKNYAATLTAVSTPGYQFLNWTENGNVVSSDSVYTFTAAGNRNLEAVFTFFDAVKGNEEAAIRLFPNPTTGKVTIENTNPDKNIKAIQLKDLLGRVIWEKNYTAGKSAEKKIEVDFSAISNGNYIVTLLYGDGSRRSVKLILVK